MYRDVRYAAGAWMRRSGYYRMTGRFLLLQKRHSHHPWRSYAAVPWMAKSGYVAGRSQTSMSYATLVHPRQLLHALLYLLHPCSCVRRMTGPTPKVRQPSYKYALYLAQTIRIYPETTHTQDCFLLPSSYTPIHPGIAGTWDDHHRIPAYQPIFGHRLNHDFCNEKD